MNSLIQLKQTTPVFLVVFAFACFGLLSQMRSAPQVAQPPDGCYPNYTTAEGCNALNFLTTGAGNSGFGWYALYSGTTGSFNTGVGGGALALNNGDSNTAVGAAALLLNTTGTLNTAVGTDALVFNDSGVDNTANGAFALFSNTTGNENTAVGVEALKNNTAGFDNTATGYQALLSNTLGLANTANGASALSSNNGGQGNTATGAGALSSNTNGNSNTATGDSALSSNTGGGNTAIGSTALGNNTTGNGNIAVGNNAGANVTTASNVTCIGAVGENLDNSCYISRIHGATSSNGIAIFINADGKLGTTTSSLRFKDQIKPMDQASDELYALRPVTFRYKKDIDPAGTSQFGLVAEEVEKVNPDLIARDKEGKPYSVRYDQVNAMLLNEFLKEHRTVQELKSTAATQEAVITELKSMLLRQQKDFQATAAHQQKQIDELTAGLQKVSAQFEVSKFATGPIRRDEPAPQVVNNP